MRIIGGDLLKATVRNDGSAFAYEEGTPVTLHLPPDAVRVLAPSAARLPRQADLAGESLGSGALELPDDRAAE